MHISRERTGRVQATGTRANTAGDGGRGWGGGGGGVGRERGRRTGLHRGEDIIGQHGPHTVAKDTYLHEKQNKSNNL